MLTLPVAFEDLIHKRVTPDEIYQTKKMLEERGKTMQYAFPYPPNQVPHVGIQCRGCGGYFEWDFLHRRGDGEDKRRNTCTPCYNLYRYYQQGKHYAHDKDRTLQKVREVELGTLLFRGGPFWSYQIEGRDYEEGKRCLYFGATGNIIARRTQHEMASSNKGVFSLFESEKERRLKQMYYVSASIVFQVYPHETAAEAYADELLLWETWSGRDNVIVLNDSKPTGIPPERITF